MSKKTAPYGTWTSPITVDVITQGVINIDTVIVDPVTSTIYHTEARSSGRNALVNTRTGADVLAGEWNVRTGVNEYGGGAVIARDGTIYFSHYTDGRVYKVKEGGTPEAITPESKVYRYADFAIHPVHPNIIIAVLEDHTHDIPSAVLTSLCAIEINSKTVMPLVKGADFYAAPTISPDGTHVAWQQWYFPDMPWEGGEIVVTSLSITEENGIAKFVTVKEGWHTVGKKNEVSASYPAWVSNDTLLFTCDESGYQNPWLYSAISHTFSPVLSTPIDEDFGSPPWQLGGSPFALLDKTGKTALFMAYRDGHSVFYFVDVKVRGSAQEVECPFADVTLLRQLGNGKPQIVFSAMQANAPSGIFLCSLSSAASPSKPTFTTLKSTVSASSGTKLPEGIISIPEPKTITVPPNNEPVYAVYYAPTNPDYAGSSIASEKPPCIVNVHGGPTGMEPQGLRWTKQFFTSRGFGWLDVNYGGSSGYGRKYIGRLAKQWGIVDVTDCIQAARSLSSGPNAIIDPKRIVIRGGSSGGYTVLAALANAPDPDNKFFAAGTSSYGISNLELLAQDSHKFESHYMEKLIGGTVEEIPKVYEDRSPMTHADRIVSPLLILQGTDDKVVPPEQAVKIVEAIQKNGGVYEYKLYEGEGHGWRKAETQEDAIKRELAFYQKQLGL